MASPTRPPRMVRRGFFEQTFSGPSAELRRVIDALNAEGLSATVSHCPFGEDDERSLGWVVAEAPADVGEHPATDVHADHMTRAKRAAEQHGYVLRLHGGVVRWVPDEATEG